MITDVLRSQVLSAQESLRPPRIPSPSRLAVRRVCVGQGAGDSPGRSPVLLFMLEILGFPEGCFPFSTLPGETAARIILPVTLH